MATSYYMQDKDSDFIPHNVAKYYKHASLE